MSENEFKRMQQPLGDLIKQVHQQLAARGGPVPEEGYHGDYVRDLAAAVTPEVWAAATAPDVETNEYLGHWAAGIFREQIERSLAAFKGSAVIDFAPAGVACHMRFPKTGAA